MLPIPNHFTFKLFRNVKIIRSLYTVTFQGESGVSSKRSEYPRNNNSLLYGPLLGVRTLKGSLLIYVLKVPRHMFADLNCPPSGVRGLGIASGLLFCLAFPVAIPKTWRRKW